MAEIRTYLDRSINEIKQLKGNFDSNLQLIKKMVEERLSQPSGDDNTSFTVNEITQACGLFDRLFHTVMDKMYNSGQYSGTMIHNIVHREDGTVHCGPLGDTLIDILNEIPGIRVYNAQYDGRVYTIYISWILN